MNKIEELLASLAGDEGLAVAYSGGVDSALVLWAAHQAQPDRCAGVIIDSPSLARRDLAVAREVAAFIGAPLVEINGVEMGDPRYLENSRERCYFCKFHGYGSVVNEAGRRGFGRILDGTNAEDVGDWRPGRRAAAERNIQSPLLELGFSKSDVRKAAAACGLPNWDKPASPCLASRVPHGLTVTLAKLARIEAAEEALRGRGFQDLRVRDFHETASVEIPFEEWPAYLRQKTAIEGDLRACGYTTVELFPGGLQSGRLSRAL